MNFVCFNLHMTYEKHEFILRLLMLDTFLSIHLSAQKSFRFKKINIAKSWYVVRKYVKKSGNVVIQKLDY